MKHATHKGKGPMPPKEHKGPMPSKEMPKTHMMPGGQEMHGEHHPTGKPAPKKIMPKRKQ